MSARSATPFVIRVPGPRDARSFFVGISLAAHVVFLAVWMLAPSWSRRPAFAGEAMVVELAGPIAGPRAASPPEPKEAPKAAAVPKPPPPKESSVVKDVIKKAKAEKVKKKDVEAPPAPSPPAPPAAGPSRGASDAPTGAGGAGVQSMALGGLELGWYGLAVQGALASRWMRPVLEDMRQELSVVVAFDIQRDGRVANARIESSSGVPSLDRSALRAVIEASPLPPVPPTWSGGHLPAQYRFVRRPGEG